MRQQDDEALIIAAIGLALIAIGISIASLWWG